MTELKIKDRGIVVPGDELAKGMDFLPGFGTYRDGDTVVASRLGIVKVDGKVIKLIPLSGRYLPKRNDMIIGKVTDVLMSGWRIDINSPYTAMLPMKDAGSSYIPRGADLTHYYAIGEYVSTKITNVTSQKLVDVTMREPGLRKLKGGRIVKVNPSKVPRIIGKGGSMVTMVKDHTKCRITIGQNGLIWLQGEPKNEIEAVKLIKRIEKEAHTIGLTDKIQKELSKK